MILDPRKHKVKIDYPCKWTYKVIGDDVDNIISAIEASAEDRNYEIIPSNVSKKGNYFSLTLKIELSSEADRLSVYDQLLSYPSIKFVL